MGSVPVQLTSSQLRGRHALISVVPPKPKRMGTWHITWYLGERPLANHTLRAISQKQFLRSLRVASTRFVLQNERGDLKIERFLPDFKGVARAGPCSPAPSTIGDAEPDENPAAGAEASCSTS